MIGLIDYGSGNIHAIANIYHRYNYPYIISNNPKELELADKLILPGVGDFDETMKLFRITGLKEIMDELVLEKKVPILGVCVGMQVMGLNSEEGDEEGLGWIKGEIKRLDEDLISDKPKLPHMGWNSIKPINNSKLFKNIDTENGFYFLHSYYFDCYNQENIIAKTSYGLDFACAINRDNIYGCQFHPEKSHKNGIEVFRNFAQL